MSSSQKTVLVTGAAGFIGSNLVEKLLELGYQVRALDNFATGHHKNIEPFLQHQNFNFIEGDIRSLETCQEVCENVDYVLHQAALGSVPRSINDPLTSNEVNVSGFLNMLTAAKDHSVKRIVYAASSSTYGDSTSLPKIEDKIGKPLSPYAVTKLVNEVYADVFHKVYGLDSIGLRYFNVFGRRQDPNGAYAAVIPKFVLQFMKYESPIINGDGTYSRDFTYIDNVVQMNLRAMQSDNPEAVNQVYNTAVGDRISILEMAEMLRDLLSKYDPKIAQIEILHGPNRKGDVPHSLASIAKAEEKLNYKPSHVFQQGLEEAVDWYWKNLKT